MSAAALAKWIGSRLIQVPAPDKVSLRHQSAETGESELVSRETVQSGDPARIAITLADALYDQAGTHARGFPGLPQRYKVVALVKGRSVGSTVFLTRSEGLNNTLALFEGSEPPTDRGLMANLMRHNEALMRALLESLGRTLAGQEEEIAKLRAERERDQERRFKFVATYEEMMDRKAERERLVTKDTRESAMRSFMASKLADTVFPALGDKLPGLIDMVMTPAGGSKDSVLRRLRGVLTSMDAEERQAFLRSLKAEARKDLESLIDDFETIREEQ